MVLLGKYLFLLNISSEMEILRYIPFFELCQDISSCINPYKYIDLLPNSYLSFPYSNMMYFVLVPFYFLGQILNLSFVNMSYLVCELILIFLLKEAFSISQKNILLILILNPVLIYSAGILGQLDFIPLTLFIVSLYFLRLQKKNYSLLFLILAFSTKIIFIILVPIVLLYFLKFDENRREATNTLFYFIFLSILINVQFIFDNNYTDTIYFGIQRGITVVNDSTLISNNSFFILVFLSFTFFIYWKNLHRLDFLGVCIFLGFITFPIYISNLSNIGWLLWSYPALLLIFVSFEYKVKIVILTFLSLLIINDQENKYLEISQFYSDVSEYLIYFLSTVIAFYSYQLLKKNIYFKIKSRPILISIAGDSASGKSTLTNLITEFFGSKFVDTVELDSFHRYERDDPIWDNKTHLDPEMNNLVKFKKTILNLVNGETQIIQNYNHLNGTFDSSNRKKIRDFLIIEGLHSLFFKDLNKRFDLKIFLDVEENLKSKTKLQRDFKRGKSEKEILKQVNQRKKDFLEFILPQTKYSDISITTLSRDSDEALFSIDVKSQYFYELKNLLNEIAHISEKENLENDGRIKFILSLNKIQIENVFESLSREIQNLKSRKFHMGPLDEFNQELMLKLSLILFLLNKKFENRL